MSACSKFSPNFFDKNKCQNCFKTKTCHLDQASEKNQNSKRIIRCNFLFISTECHSAIENFKTRKWQRRWFILYSDSELTYALDESLLTLPQNRIILKNCEKIYLSPEVHEYAITIVHSDKLYYIRANYADEMRKWFEDMCFHVNSFETKNILNKCIVVNAVTKLKELPDNLNEDIKNGLTNNNLTSESKKEKINIQPKPRLSKFKNKLNNQNFKLNSFCVNSENNVLNDDEKSYSKLMLPVDEKCFNIYQNIDYVNLNKNLLLATSEKCISYNDIYKFSKNDDRVFDNIKLKNSDILNKNNYQNLKNYSPEKKFSSNSNLKENFQNDFSKPSQINLKDAKLENKIALPENKINLKKKKNLNKSLPDLRFQSNESCEKNQVNNQSAKLKDICFLNKKIYSESKLQNSKTGWLMRKGQNKQWFKHWFVLKDTLLTYYRDQSAEINSLLDGILDLALIKNIQFNSCFEIAQVMYYPFQITMWDEKQHELASMSFESREAWLKLILDSKSLKNYTDFNANNIEKNEFYNCQFNDNKCSNKIKEKLKKESDSESSDSNAVVCQVFNGDQIPSSPPLNRNAVSRMKLKFKDVKNNFKTSFVKTNFEEKIVENSSKKNDSKEFLLNQLNFKLNSSDFNLQTDSGLASSEDNGNLLNSTLTLNDYLSDYDVKELSEDKNLESNKKTQLNQNLDQNNVDLNLIKNSSIQLHEKLKNKFKKQIIENSEKIAFELSHKDNKAIFDEELKSFQNLLQNNNHSPDFFKEENEINNIKNTIVELHKFCLSIINEIQITHSDVTEMKRNLIQKDLIGLLLGNQFVNGSNNKQLFSVENLLDTFTNQIIDTLMEKLNFSKDNNIEEILSKKNKEEQMTNKENLNDNLCDTNCKKQIELLKNKNDQLEKKLKTSIKTVQRLNTELKESHANYDHLEIAFCWMQNELKSMLRIRKEEYELMQEKINYLTSKLVQVEKAYRENLSKFSLPKN